MILGRFNYLIGALSLAAAYSAYPAHAASDKPPECACLVPMTQAAAPVGSLKKVSGNVMVTHAAGFATAAEGAQLAPGSRVIVGADSTAALQVGSACALSLAQNSTATLLQQDQQLCVQVTAPQPRSVTLTSPEKSYGADMPEPLPVEEPVRRVPYWMAIPFIVGGACAIWCRRR